MLPGCAARPQAIIDGVVKALEILEQKRQQYAENPEATKAEKEEG